MAPKKATIEKQLAETVRRIYSGPDRDDLTVNYVRQEVEKKLNLDEGFLKDGDWKAKSKEIIHETLSKLQEDEAPSSQAAAPTPPAKTKAKAKPAPKPAAKPKNGAKPQPKRAKKVATPSDQSESESELSDVSEPTAEDSASEESELSEEEPPKKKRAVSAKRGAKKRKAVSDDEDEEEDELSSEISDIESEEERPKKKTKVTPKKTAPKKEAPKKPAPKPKAKAEVVASDTESSLLSEIPEDEADKEDVREDGSGDEDRPKKAAAKSQESKKESKEEESAADSDSEMSVVIDEPPKRKRKSKSAEPSSKVSSKPQKSRGPSKSAAPLAPEQAKLKELQAQLLKCGVRKVWAFELKQYGDDVKAKARHLKGMLEEIGMTGRFSEAKAREIKERRELMADLDAVKEGEKHWGLCGGGRLSRRRGPSVKNLKEPSDEDEEREDGDGEGKKVKKGKAEAGDEGADDDDEDEEDAQPKPRRPPKHRADLAFLDDESDSD